MKIIIEGKAKEIAGLLTFIKGQQSNDVDAVTKSINQTFADYLQRLTEDDVQRRQFSK